MVRGRMRAVFSSGGPLPGDAAELTQAMTGCSPFEVFGSSETGGIAWRRRAVHGERWQPLPGVAWRVEDEALSVRSPHLPDGAWWPTADRVQASDDGGFVLLGRADRIVKIEGKRVSLGAIERALLEGGDVAEVRALLLPLDGRLAVVTVPSVAGRARLLGEGRRAFNERLRASLLRVVERVALPRRWRHVVALPADTQGKCSGGRAGGTVPARGARGGLARAIRRARPRPARAGPGAARLRRPLPGRADRPPAWPRSTGRSPSAAPASRCRRASCGWRR
ncbi:MAG: hypothetical protein MZW92_66695 [Comamonadaceae bacterium]|nr:hypothetical protein [Comamonadaceae bacterium]